jgi:5-methylcytosine-specific restriction protein B
LEPTITFTLRGKTFEKRKDDFVKATKGLEPGRIKKYSVAVSGKRYPIRQVLAAVTKLPAIAITSQDAYRVLEKFGFSVDTEE